MNDTIEPVVFTCDKPMALNAIYDVIDSLGLVTEHINSERGVILVQTPDGISIRITVDTVYPAKHAKVGAVVTREAGRDWARVIFDELSSTLVNERRVKEGI